MELIEIAQLVTGLATLIVASVLIWQMIIQKRTLDIAHNDADANMSLLAMESRSEQNRWFYNNLTEENLMNLKKNYEDLSEKEKLFIQTNFMNHTQVLATEWRLGRVDRNEGYYKNTFKRHMRLGDFQSARDYYLNFRQSRLQSTDKNPLVDPNFHNLGEKAYEEITGKKFEN